MLISSLQCCKEKHYSDPKAVLSLPDALVCVVLCPSPKLQTFQMHHICCVI